MIANQKRSAAPKIRLLVVCSGVNIKRLFNLFDFDAEKQKNQFYKTTVLYVLRLVGVKNYTP
ncbi:hypothetical protein B188_27660 [Candidatus Brocadiaceae bacterium B188]|jgi:hypothetical protein|nr:MAG: hypothetical protein B6D34_07635 [Candidatus Brocadia sp. UTAMX1]TWU50335.1 hypothetical protein B188_27660 [Candidatus Brocadiaceae bacterium B188]